MKNIYSILTLACFLFASSAALAEESKANPDEIQYEYISDFDSGNVPCGSLSVIGSVTNVTCWGGNDGTITLTVNNGNPPYTYLWNDGSTMMNRTGLSRGVHTVTVTDDSSCVQVVRRWVNSPSRIRLNDVTTPASCKGSSDGSILTATMGGTSPYTYLWNDGSTSNSRTGLARGVYTVTVTDAAGCMRVFHRWINDPPAIIVTGSATAVTCHGDTDGAINITASGGHAPYTYMWNDGDTNEDRTGLASGAYTVAVTGSGTVCTGSLTVWVGSPGKLRATTVVTNATCYTSNDGSITTTTAGGTPPYTYLWSNGTTTADNNNIGRGGYTLTITDDNGCQATIVRWVGSPNMLFVGVQIKNPTTSSSMDGWAKANVFGGTPPYTYAWSDGQTTQTATGLSTGSITVVVTDANGCMASKMVTLVPLTSIDDPDSEDAFTFNVFPNPSTNNFTVQLFTRNAAYYDLQLVDISGRIVDVDFTRSESDMYEFGEQIKPGVYFLRIIGKGVSKSVRIVKI